MRICCRFEIDAFYAFYQESFRDKFLLSGKFSLFVTLPVLKILSNHLLCAFVVNLKIDAIYALYPESFCDKNLAIRKVFAFCDSAQILWLSPATDFCKVASLKVANYKASSDLYKIDKYTLQIIRSSDYHLPLIFAKLLL